ncbi:MAG TPA: hypothetical protein VFH54_14510 [Mycobacteriales bacterium]|nr:hypothetical protein [Mycobacteriales bacterium]
MLTWVLVGVLLGAGGLAVLGGLTWRLWRQVRQLGRDIAAAGARISAATDELARVSPRK